MNKPSEYDRLKHHRPAQANVLAMVTRRPLAAGLDTKIGNHTFRATGITAYLIYGGTLENAATMADHASTRIPFVRNDLHW